MGKRGRSARAAGRLPASPNRPSNSDGPKPIVTVRLAGDRPAASPVSAGGAAGVVLSPGTIWPAHIAAAAAVQVFSSS